jgi:hypothetical protein
LRTQLIETPPPTSRHSMAQNSSAALGVLQSTLAQKNTTFGGAHTIAGYRAKSYSGSTEAVGAVAATAPSVVLTSLPLTLTGRSGTSLTDDKRCQRAPYEGCSHQLERLIAREHPASQPACQLVEGVVGSFLAHLLPPFPEGRDTRGLAPPGCTTKISRRGYKPWRNFGEFCLCELP